MAKGSIKQRGDSFQIRVSLGKDSATGKYTSHFETFHGNMTEARKRLRELLTELDKGIFVRPGKSTLEEYLKTWLNDYCKPNLSPRTCELYEYMCNYHIKPTLGKIPLTDLRPAHLQHLYSEKQSSGLSGRTVQLMHVTIHKALKNAVNAGLLSQNPADRVDKPKIQRREMKTLNERELHIFLEMARSTDYYALFYIYLFTGMRRSEAIALRWQDVDLLLCQLNVTRSMQYLYNVPGGSHVGFKQPKTQKSRRVIALSPSTVAVLREHSEAQNKQRQLLELPPAKDSDLVFSHWNGSPFLPDSITHAWVKLVRRCGLRGIRLHDARHTHASLMLKQGVSPKVISERLGHAGVAITLDLYAHTTPGMQQAAADKFDDIVLQRTKQES
jgi:integrase